MLLTDCVPFFCTPFLNLSLFVAFPMGVHESESTFLEVRLLVVLPRKYRNLDDQHTQTRH